jgi:hypothetical protein
VGFDRAVRGGHRHAGEYEAGGELVLVEKSLIVLVDTAADQLASTGRTGASTAGYRQINV